MDDLSETTRARKITFEALNADLSRNTDEPFDLYCNWLATDWWLVQQADALNGRSKSASLIIGRSQSENGQEAPVLNQFVWKSMVRAMLAKYRQKVFCKSDKILYYQLGETSGELENEWLKGQSGLPVPELDEIRAMFTESLHDDHGA